MNQIFRFKTRNIFIFIGYCLKWFVKDTTVKIDDNELRNLKYINIISLSKQNSISKQKINRFELHMR